MQQVAHYTINLINNHDSKKQHGTSRYDNRFIKKKNKPCQLKNNSPSVTTLFLEWILRKLVTQVALKMEYANTQLELYETELLILLSGSKL